MSIICQRVQWRTPDVGHTYLPEQLTEIAQNLLPARQEDGKKKKNLEWQLENVLA